MCSLRKLFGLVGLVVFGTVYFGLVWLVWSGLLLLWFGLICANTRTIDKDLLDVCWTYIMYGEIDEART